MCAHEQGKFWEYHEELYSWEYGWGQAAYLKIAADLKLDVAAFEECITIRRYQSWIEADQNYAAGVGVRSTPTIFINGIPIVGAQPFDLVKQIIDAELEGKIPK
jgi:protein-disulfide isomerase